MKKAFRLILLLLLAFILVLPACAETEEDDWDEDEWSKAYDEAYSEYCRIGGGTLTLLEGVETLGDYYEKEKDPEIEALFNNNPGEYLRFNSVDDELHFSKIVWPSSIRILGSESFYIFHFDTLTLPASLELLCQDVFIYCGIKTLRIECALPVDQIYYSMYDSYIDAYEVPEDHPLYKTIDGVLYSKDGKTLLLYPNSREDEHFDVPAGVECIARHAFCGNEYLKTVSLPIGLKTLEDLAFAGCGSLQSIAVPLTVTHIGTDVFYSCIALERVSLPAGLEADKDDSWCEYYPDDSLFRGDNWDTSAQKPSKESSGTAGLAFGTSFAWVKDVDQVPVYETDSSLIPASSVPGGIPVHVVNISSSMALIKRAATDKEIGWVEITMLDYYAGDLLFDMKIIPTEEFITAYDLGPEDEENWYTVEAEGPWAHFAPLNLYVPLTAVELYRDPLPGYGSDELGITSDSNYLKKLPLLDAPDGSRITDLHMGTQVRILEEQDSWVRVSTGYDTGWIQKEFVRIVPVKPDTKEE